MTNITFNEEDMIVRVEGIDKLLSFKGSINIPLVHIENAELNSEPLMDFKHATFGIGTIFAGRIQAGSFKEDGEKSFWDVHDPKNAILITLKDEEYAKLLLEVEDPQATVNEIKQRIA